jgi:hypothetical protein
MNDFKSIDVSAVPHLKYTPRDNDINNIKKMLENKVVLAEGKYDALVKMNMSPGAMNKTFYEVSKKISANILPVVTDEVNEIAKSLSTLNIVNPNNSVPTDFYKLICYGKTKEAYPDVVGVTACVPYELNLKEVMKAEGFTEDELKTQLDNIKAWWTMASQGASSPMIDLAKTINSKEDELYKKACDYVNIVAGKTLTKPYNVSAIYALNKNCGALRYYQDPWITFFTKMICMRIKENMPYYEISFDLTSLGSSNSFNSCTAKYYTTVTLHYKVNKSMFKIQFERNGNVF